LQTVALPLGYAAFQKKDSTARPYCQLKTCRSISISAILIADRSALVFAHHKAKDFSVRSDGIGAGSSRLVLHEPDNKVKRFPH
jgi:hypothetical protein